MKKIFAFIICYTPKFIFAQHPGVIFKSSDTAMGYAFAWAKEMALHYKGKATDPVGPWYESALPPRYAFCMRDVSHQCIGGEILGLRAENKNMFTLFAKNISENKDWCTYWEINKFAKPAPEDYRNDKEFWYNLPSNFDLVTSLWKLYLWTGNKEYLTNKGVKNFAEKSMNEYVSRWVLSPDSLLSRPAHPNAPRLFHAADPFHRSRGLPSYSEGVPNLKMGIDLVAAIYRGLLSYSDMATVNGDKQSAEIFAKKAQAYKKHIDEYWWDKKDSLYFTYYSNDQQFGKNEGEVFVLWFDVLNNGPRKQKTIEHILSMDLNVENLSYLPLLLYQNGYWEQAYDKILQLAAPTTERREYPEVSFGVIEGIVQGLIGVSADARTSTVSTLYRTKNNVTSAMMNLPVLQTTIDVTHLDTKQSSIMNKGKSYFTWRAMFMGKHSMARAGGKTYHLKDGLDKNGAEISYLDIRVDPGKKITVALL